MHPPWLHMPALAHVPAARLARTLEVLRQRLRSAESQRDAAAEQLMAAMLKADAMASDAAAAAELRAALATEQARVCVALELLGGCGAGVGVDVWWVWMWMSGSFRGTLCVRDCVMHSALKLVSLKCGLCKRCGVQWGWGRDIVAPFPRLSTKHCMEHCAACRASAAATCSCFPPLHFLYQTDLYDTSLAPRRPPPPSLPIHPSIHPPSVAWT
eukprot:364238-Chlamydomonas_euryale.AAC.2